MTPQQFQNQLSLIKPEELSGSIRDRFHAVMKETGLYWKDIIQYYAENGYRWKDAADQFGVKRSALYSACRARGVTFPFQGKQGFKYRELRADAMEGSPAFYTPPNKIYTAFGVSGTAVDLIKKFGHHSLTRASFQCRVNRGWPVEESLILPNGQRRARV